METVDKKTCVSLMMIYGDIDFDGRAKRVLDIAATFGPVSIVDAAIANPHRFGQEYRTTVPLQQKWSVLRRHSAFWLQSWIVARKLRPDFIYAQNYFSVFPGFVAAKLTGAKLIYDAYELIIPEKDEVLSFRDYFWYLMERMVAPRSDLVIAANPERADIMGERYQIGNKLLFMRNIPDTSKYSAKDIELVLDRYPALKRRGQNDIILIYQGHVSLDRGVGRFVDVLRRLPKNFRLVIAGDGPDLINLSKIAEDLIKEDRFSTLGRVPNDILPCVTRNADIGIVTYPHKGRNNIYCAPNKIFEYALAGLPVISSDQTSLRALLKEMNAGVLFEQNESALSIANKIRTIVTPLPTIQVESIATKYSNNFEKKRVTDRIRQLVASI